MSEGAKKLDAGKLPVMRGVFLRFPRAMYEIARVSQAGTTKYAVPIDDMNYKNVPDGQGRYTDALGRHLLDEAINGQINIEKGGALPAEGVALLHAAQAAWDSLARLEILLEARAAEDEEKMPGDKVSRDTSYILGDGIALRGATGGPLARQGYDGGPSSTKATTPDEQRPAQADYPQV